MKSILILGLFAAIMVAPAVNAERREAQGEPREGRGYHDAHRKQQDRGRHERRDRDVSQHKSHSEHRQYRPHSDKPHHSSSHSNNHHNHHNHYHDHNVRYSRNSYGDCFRVEYHYNNTVYVSVPMVRCY